MKIEKVKILVANLHEKNEYVIHTKNLKQTLNDGLILKKVNRFFKFNQEAWLNAYIDLNTVISRKICSS